MSLVENIIRDHIKQNVSVDIKNKLAHIVHESLMSSSDFINKDKVECDDRDVNSINNNIIDDERGGIQISNFNVNVNHDKNKKENKDKENIMRFIENDNKNVNNLKMYNVPS